MVTRTVSRARRTARRAAGSPAMAWLARTGLAVRGTTYILVGVIAVKVAIGGSRQQADRSGAVRLVAHTTFGAVILWLLMIGFAGLTLWRLSEAIWGGARQGGRAAARRLANLARAALYAVITYGTLLYALGVGQPPSSDSQSQDLTAAALRYRGGRWVVVIVGGIVVLAGLYTVYGAYRKRFLKDLRLGSASVRTRKIVARLGQIGGIARGLVFCVIGVFLVIAARDASPRQAKGIDSALRTLAHTPLGPWLLVIVAVGLVLFGAYSWCEARWRAV